MKHPKQLVEWGDRSILLKAREVKAIIEVAQGKNIKELMPNLTQPANSNFLHRIAAKLRNQTGKEIAHPRSLICWFAYSSGLVKL